jgi:general secretion pathway protein F
MAGVGRIPDKLLADALYRLSIAVGAGIDLRRAWVAEMHRVPARWRPALGRVAARLDAGDGLGEAAAASQGAIPDAVAGMLCVGDRTGRLAEVLEETAAGLARSVATRRAVRAALVGPAIRLVAAMIVIVVLIVVSSSAGRGSDAAPDLLGLGFGGAVTLLAALVVGAGLVGAGLVGAAAMGSGWIGHGRGWAAQLGRCLPVVGPAARAAEEAAWCRAASLAAHAGVSVGGILELASRAAGGVGCDPPRVEEHLRSGRDLPEALARASRLSRRVIEAVAVGEATGTTAEALDRVADQLDAAARRGFAAAVQVTGFVAWAVVAGLVAFLVIRVGGTCARMFLDPIGP